MGVSACMHVCTHTYAVPAEAREGIRLPGTGVSDSCKILYVCWESNMGPLPEQPELLTTEPPLQTQNLSNLRLGYSGCNCVFLYHFCENQSLRK